jgi:tRNA 2-thiocytidine biosynthesis protein TtcA
MEIQSKLVEAPTTDQSGAARLITAPSNSTLADSKDPDTHNHAGQSGNRSFEKIRKRLRRNVGRAIEDYHMIEQGDRVMVCLSGGKDSYTMLDILLELQKKAPVDFELVAVNLDQKQPGYPEHILPKYLENKGIAFDIIEKDTYSVVKRVIPEGKTMCGLCSRLRRGNLYGYAEKRAFNKIALGHHRDDIIETLFLNMFHGGKLSAMPPKLRSDDGKNIVIRPLAYCAEKDISAYAEVRNYPIIPCTLCGSQEQLQRRQTKQMLSEWSKFPGRVENIFRAICNVAPSQLGDTALFDFDAFLRRGEAGKSPNVNKGKWIKNDPR